MSWISKNRSKTFVLLLTFCLTPAPALGNLTTKKEKRDRPEVVSPAPFIAGKLVTRGSQPVLVNGNIVGAGTTVLSGANVQTFDSGRVTVSLGALGSLELAPYTLATLDFTGNNIVGTLRRGCAKLNTGANVKGTLVTLDGATPRTVNADGVGVTTVDLCSATTPGQQLPNDAMASIAAANAYNNRFSEPSPFSFGPTGTLALVGASTYFAGGGTLGRSAAINTDLGRLKGGCCCCCCCCPQNPSPSSPGC